MTSSLVGPLLLRPDNFTPRQRTPWGVQRLGNTIKSFAQGEVIGESWEVSVEPDFPSVLADGRPLQSVVQDHPEAILGAHAARDGGLALLVKLLDAATPLSVQIHPADDDPALGPGESGKPESWYILHAEPGAGIYLGLAEGVREETMAQAIRDGEDVSALLSFVPCAPGDFFVLPAGTAHAVGAGLTLVEPQRVLPGKRGLTYRYWDWNRRYDGEGKPSPDGQPRALHLPRALAVTDWAAPRGAAGLQRLRHRAGSPVLTDRAAYVSLCGPPADRAPLSFDALRVGRLAGSGDLRPQDWLSGAESSAQLGTAQALTCVDGRMQIGWAGGSVNLEAGASALLPACLENVTLHLENAHALLSSLP